MKLLGWLFVIGLLVICLASFLWFYSRHGKYGLFILVGIMAAVIAYFGFQFYKGKKV